MTIGIEISGPAAWKPSLFKTHRSYRMVWLWFAVFVWLEPYEKMLMEPHDWIMDGRRFYSYEQLKNTTATAIKPREVEEGKP